MFKRSLFFIIIFSLLTSIVPTYSYAASSPNTSVTITSSQGNIRQSPSLTSPILATLDKGTQLPVRTFQNGWYEVAYAGNATGWIASSIVTTLDNVLAGRETKPVYARSQVDKITITNEPIPEGDVAGQLARDESFIVLYRTNTWAYVRTFSNIEGWIPNDASTFTTLTNFVSRTIRSDVDMTLLDGKTTSLNYGEWLVTLEVGRDRLRVLSSKGEGWIDRSETSTDRRNWVETVYTTSKSTVVFSTNSTLSKRITSLSIGFESIVYGSTSTMLAIELPSGTIGWVRRSDVLETKYYDNMNFDLQLSSFPLKGKKIVIDAGHGNQDTGAIGTGRIYEKNLNLAIAKALQSELVSYGATVIMTRSNDTFLSLTERSNISNRNTADLFISVHHNSSSSKTARGYEVYYLKENSVLAAKHLSRGISVASNSLNRGIIKNNYAVLRNNNRPAVLLELGFVSNPTELKILNSTSWQTQVATSMAAGVLDYFTFEK
ncbi:MAG: N-acetylmuramoyl-L-alanine amidase [Bacilli bacterium]